MLGNKYARAEGKSYASGIEKECYGTGSADCGKSILAKILSDNNRIHYIVELLEKVPEQERYGEFYYAAEFAAGSHGLCVSVHIIAFQNQLLCIISLFCRLSIPVFRTENSRSRKTETAVPMAI